MQSTCKIVQQPEPYPDSLGPIMHEKEKNESGKRLSQQDIAEIKEEFESK